jgi:hypothetical protein
VQVRKQQFQIQTKTLKFCLEKFTWGPATEGCMQPLVAWPKKTRVLPVVPPVFFSPTFGRTPPLKHVIEALSMAIRIELLPY